MSSFIGHFHPVFVHLPIGILILAFLLQWIDRNNKTDHYDRAITLALLIGMFSAIASCISGYFLSRSDDYDEQLVGRHQWLGIGVAIITIVLYFLRKKGLAVRWQWPIMIGLFLLIIITGHIGGSLTHGSEYLTQPFNGLLSDKPAATAQRVPIPDVQEAVAYKEVIQPVLATKCYSCHNKNKQKGKFRMDLPELLLQGGKNGVTVMAGKADESELIKRLLLPREDEHHMPPKEKPQLTEQEIRLLHWWIASGASFDKKVKELEQPPAIKPVLVSLQNMGEIKALPDLPSEPVEKADEAAIKKLKELGVIVMPVAQNSNYLTANFITATAVKNSDLQLLLPLKKQLVSVKLGNTAISDSALALLAQCTNIMRLQLDHTRITDKGLADLLPLHQLRYLNLVGTNITAAGVLQLTALKELQSIYCYQTGIAKEDWGKLQKAFPKTRIDSGGYKLPMLESDTTEVKRTK